MAAQAKAEGCATPKQGGSMTERFTDLGAGSAGARGGRGYGATRIGAAVTAEAETGDERTVALSFSSEAPVLRDCHFGTGWEVLGHLPEEVDLSRVAANAVPLLADHRRSLDAKLGSVTSAQIIGARGRATVRFAETPEAEAMLAASARARCKACLSDTSPTPLRWWAIWKASRWSA